MKSPHTLSVEGSPGERELPTACPGGWGHPTRETDLQARLQADCCGGAASPLGWALGSAGSEHQSPNRLAGAGSLLMGALGALAQPAFQGLRL